jgi:hypothetical protein
MDSNSLNNEWKEKLMELKNENKFNVYELLKQMNNIILEYYEKEKNYSVKRKLIKNSWNCDSIKEYILFLEEKLSASIGRLKLYEEGFDERNKLLSLNNYKKK